MNHMRRMTGIVFSQVLDELNELVCVCGPEPEASDSLRHIYILSRHVAFQFECRDRVVFQQDQPEAGSLCKIERELRSQRHELCAAVRTFPETYQDRVGAANVIYQPIAIVRDTSGPAKPA